MKFLTSAVFAALATSVFAREGREVGKKAEQNEAPSCNSWYIAKAEDTTSTIEWKFDLLESVLFDLNPALKANSVVKAGWGYCVGIPPTRAFNPDQFPPRANEPFQCIRAISGQPTPPSTISGHELEGAIKDACAQILPGGAKWLEKGQAYAASVLIPDNWTKNPVTFEVKIWKGGFLVPTEVCVKQLRDLYFNCYWARMASSTYGGCSYSNDLNLQTCIFP
ncbi:hypothetical protein ABW21_db0201594 [Orbilia brochopaga]|nr:hypothetical protein ABW21_db0201594 [Drechslerella brochopaga]